MLEESYLTVLQEGKESNFFKMIVSKVKKGEEIDLFRYLFGILQLAIVGGVTGGILAIPIIAGISIIRFITRNSPAEIDILKQEFHASNLIENIVYFFEWISTYYYSIMKYYSSNHIYLGMIVGTVIGIVVFVYYEKTRNKEDAANKVRKIIDKEKKKTDPKVQQFIDDITSKAIAAFKKVLK